MKLKVKMADLGVTPQKHTATIAKPDTKPRYPSLRLSADKLPELSDAKVGDKGTLAFDYEVTGYKTAEDYDDHPKGTHIVSVDLKKGCAYADGKKSKPLSGHSSNDAVAEAAEEGKTHDAVSHVRKQMKEY